MNNRKGGNQVVLDLLPPARSFSMFGGMDYAAVAQRIRRIEHDQAMQKTLKKMLQQCQNT